MKPIQSPLLLASLLSLSFLGCDTENEDPPSLHKDYFPIEPGHSITYEVDSMRHDSALELHDTSHFFIREELANTFINDEGRTSYRIERFKKDSAEGTWRVADVWVANRSDVRAERVEENRRFIKMVFPVSSVKDWDGNAYNTLEEEEYEYRELHMSRNIGGIQLDSTVQVLQKDIDNLIEREFAQEIYAKGIGLVQKERIELETYPSGEIRRGSELYMRMTQYRTP